jgi:hypothetical protein
MIPAVLAGALGMSGAVAMATEPTAAELREQIEALQQKVAQLESRSEQAEVAKNVDATVESVLRDAERRSQMMNIEGFTAGWDNGFKLRSADGSFEFQPTFLFQMRHVTNYRDDGGPDDDDSGDSDSDIQKGFEIGAMNFGFKGSVCSPDLTYLFTWESEDGKFELQDAYIQYQLNDGFAFRFGQFKDVVYHEELVHDGKQLAVDRSLVNQLIGGHITDRVQGVALIFAPEGQFRGTLAVHDGINTDNTNFTYKQGGTSDTVGGPGGISTNWGVSGRVEFFAQGTAEQYSDFTARGSDEGLLVFGGGLSWTQDGDDNIALHTVDVQWESGPVGIYVAYLGSWLEGGDSNDDDIYDFGALAQIGFMLNDNWEIFGRTSWTQYDDDRGLSGHSFHEYTAGVNYYFCDHNAKMTIDLTWLPDGVPDGESGLKEVDYLADGNGEDQLLIRGQFQLWF